MLLRHIHRALSQPPHKTAKEAAEIILQLAYATIMQRRDKKESTYEIEWPTGQITSYLSNMSSLHLSHYANTLSCVANHYLGHHFDLLGSGWVQVKHGMKCRGLEGNRYNMGESVLADPVGRWLEGRINRSNLEESQRIWQLIYKKSSEIISQKSDITYKPIDWHLDFKSGYRWNESTWYKDIRFGHKLGVDVKVPWELARMQHLPMLAYGYALARAGNADFQHAALYAREFRNQILDFIATNPPRYGVNWACTMDVAIRVANWLIACDTFRAYGMQFDEDFERLFKRSVYEHGVHIINNLEWGESLRNNHYLSDITGLLFVAAYLPCTPETNAWLAFAVRELIKEVKTQFYPDGGNFEASTSYHRLSAEMVAYATALVLCLPENKTNALRNYDHTLIKVKPGLRESPIPFYNLPIRENSKLKTQNTKSTSPFPPWYFERLEKMAEFTMHITKPNNHIPQIGDNDSGRFFKLHPMYNKMTVAEAKKRYFNLAGYDDLPDDAIYWDEDFLDHRHLVAAINGLFGRDDFAVFADSVWLENDIVRHLAGGICLSSYKRNDESTAAEKARAATSDSGLYELRRRLEECPENQKHTMKIPLPDGAAENLKLYVYPDFGFYIYRTNRLYLSIRCGPVGQNGNGGHAHNDQLSVELNVDGKDWIADPGTYLYTPLPERRNEYRSVKAHFAPQVEGDEAAVLNAGLFNLENAVGGVCLYFGSQGFVGKHCRYGRAVWRVLHVMKDKLSIIDYASKNIPKNITVIEISQKTIKECINISTCYGVRYV